MNQVMELPDGAAQWMADLARLGHYLEPDTALKISLWWQQPEPLILEGPPGGGKTSLALRIAEAKGAAFYRLPCHKALSARESLYTWNSKLQDIALESAARNGELTKGAKSIIYDDAMLVCGVLAEVLLDPADEVVLLIDELDKVPAEEAFEALLLEFLGESCITVTETGKRLTRGNKPLPHTIITSNAGRFGDRESLSKPVLRRSRYVYLPPPSEQRQLNILRDGAPGLSADVLTDCVLFIKWAGKVFSWEKPISLSETIMWVRDLEQLRVTQLTVEIAKSTLFSLAKTPADESRLITAMERIFYNIASDRNSLESSQLEE